jgi:hypothetical protein
LISHFEFSSTLNILIQSRTLGSAVD